LTFSGTSRQRNCPTIDINWARMLTPIMPRSTISFPLSAALRMTPPRMARKRSTRLV
jgi:hypothetical protein